MKSLTFVVVALVLSMAFRPPLYGAERAMDTQDPMTVIQRYLRATYARDFVAAYRFISAEDRNVRDVNRYVQQRGPYSGFILDAARKLSEFIEVGTLNAQESPRGVRVAIKYRVPDPQKIAPLLLNWDPRRLNSLPAAERKQIIDALDQRKQQGSLEMSEGTETFELIREADEWRVFLNWAAGVKIPLKLDLSKSPDLDVMLSKNEFVVQPGDLFEIVLKIKNRTQQPMTVRIGHLVEPSHDRRLSRFRPVRFSPAGNGSAGQGTGIFRHLYAARQSSRRRPGPEPDLRFSSA